MKTEEEVKKELRITRLELERRKANLTSDVIMAAMERIKALKWVLSGE